MHYLFNSNFLINFIKELGRKKFELKFSRTYHFKSINCQVFFTITVQFREVFPISGFRFFRSWIFLFYFRILTRRFWSPSCWKRLATLSPRSSRPSSSWFDGMPWTWLRLCPDITPTPTSYSSQCKTSDFAIFPDGFLKPVPGFSGKNLNFALLCLCFMN